MASGLINDLNLSARGAKGLRARNDQGGHHALNTKELTAAPNKLFCLQLRCFYSNFNISSSGFPGSRSKLAPKT